MVKLSVVCILLSSIVQLKASRLLQAISPDVQPPIGCTDDIAICPDGSDVSRDDNNNCEFFPCPDGTCVTPNKCVNPITNKCEPEVLCFAYPCAVSDPGCTPPETCVANYCGGCHALCQVPTCATTPCPKGTFCSDTLTGPECLDIGDTCGLPPNDCAALRCLCGVCPNQRTKWGCCGSCVVEDSGKGLECSGMISRQRACKCGGYGDLCVEYFDGCNQCVCHSDGSESCTEMACVAEAIGKPKCTECVPGYVPNNDGECREVKRCGGYAYSNLDPSGCDAINGFQCWWDIVCRGQWGQNSYCDSTNFPTVCLDVSGSCANDLDCGMGYKCVGSVNGRGFCVKYE